ncbi:MAG: hypothetical protein A3G80_04170 [Betaproteobacteria bacterium RIFCSPLOWO2_12_FULL_62_13b]|nr:MAG: hypothetical protein A3G80_04170 [Betaproteobacteria bacterium RIFCSPLOWO2_12_FULL_62_13b]
MRNKILRKLYLVTGGSICDQAASGQRETLKAVCAEVCYSAEGDTRLQLRVAAVEVRPDIGPFNAFERPLFISTTAYYRPIPDMSRCAYPTFRSFGIDRVVWAGLGPLHKDPCS